MRSFADLYVAHLRPSILISHPYFLYLPVAVLLHVHLPTSPFPPFRFLRVFQGGPDFFFSSPLGSTTPSSSAPLLHNLSSLHIPQIRDVAPPTALWLPAVALCKSYPNGLPLPFVCLLPPESPMTHLQISSLSSPWSFSGNMCASPLSSFQLTPKGPTFPTHTIKSLTPPPCRNLLTPFFLPPPVKVVSLASPRPTLYAWFFDAQSENRHPFGLGVILDIGRLVHSPLSCLPHTHVGWTPFPHTLPPSPHPFVGAVSPSIYGTCLTANV